MRHVEALSPEAKSPHSPPRPPRPADAIRQANRGGAAESTPTPAQIEQRQREYQQQQRALAAKQQATDSYQQQQRPAAGKSSAVPQYMTTPSTPQRGGSAGQRGRQGNPLYPEGSGASKAAPAAPPAPPPKDPDKARQLSASYKIPSKARLSPATYAGFAPDENIAELLDHSLLYERERAANLGKSSGGGVKLHANPSRPEPVRRSSASSSYSVH
jgi:hypothetical protein